ncbi:DUF1501 domain-containing protein [Nocardioides pantholopis]|uniref:DUF1501 domain-containing protein n=1 Tax=Nocardioides pantholopis TaxID=2483798 RepID=UPI000F0848B1|nr:DUF1501 domain-containing protein [Nocardioides pantholopis]
MTEIPDSNAPCCDDFRATSRRGFLRGSVAVGGAALVGVAHGTAFTETAYAATGTADRVLVVLSMRGAADGLSLVVPHADPAYYAARPSIAVPADQLLARDAMFGLHPSLAPLLPLWQAGRMAAVHATGLPVPNRSHFSAMEEVEDADPGSPERIGWLNRLVGRNGTGSPLEAIQYGGGVPAMAVTGPQPTLASSDVDSVWLAGPTEPDGAAARRAALRTAWAGSSGPLANGMAATIDVVDEFAAVRAVPAAPGHGATYPADDLGKALASAARTIRADVGAEVITVDHGSWDHHTWIGTTASGNLTSMAQVFARSVAAFFTDLGPLADRVTLVTISEFGRRVVENANGGLDHGHGNVMFLIGAGVRGGRYYGTWPGLTRTSDADLLVTTDYRQVLGEVVTTRLGASSAQVFPGFSPQDPALGAMSSL